ncbi:CHAT domain-containing protein [Aquincola sp. S2]|uniref:CHAT domain-containing protein n=1 Tax=Pseudaquabacterium terrae TaxID=2732868 RepID=A0ABX2EK24_9BURK|nr:CHAT domain-containing tetratricopeptide repeat protein [Aquabacterium terrae]NRF69015.1 CHAT domain-containing protein [Aquabacterium terrae]
MRHTRPARCCLRRCALLAAGVVLVSCGGLQRQAVERAAAMGQGGQHAAAETALRELMQPRQGAQQISADEALLLRSKLIPLLENQGRLGEALELAQQVHQQWKARRGERAPNTIAALGNLGRLYAAIGRLPQALQAQEQGMRLAIEVMGAWHEAAISARNNLAATYLGLQRVDDALRLQETALEASRRTLGATHLQTLVALSNLSRTYLAAGRLDDAVAAGAGAAQGLHEVAGAASPYALVARAHHVAALSARGDTAQALALQPALLAASRSVWGTQHRFTLEQLAVQARLQARSGRPAAALALAEGFIAGAEQVRSQPGLAAEDRRALFAAYADDYRFFSALHGAAGEPAPGFRLSELSKARTLLESMSQQSASRSSVLPEAERQRLQQLEQALHEHEKLISEGADARAREPLLLRRDAALREYEAVVTALKAQYPKFAQLRDPRIVAAADLPGLVPRGAVYIGYGLRGDHLFAWLVEHEGLPRYVDLGEIAHLAEAVEALRRATSHVRGLQGLLAAEGRRVWRLPDGSFRLRERAAPVPPGAVVVERESELIDHLGSRLLQPLAALIGGRRHWIVSPDGALAQLPFELLAFQGRRVLETIDLHYAQSLSVYAMARAQQLAYRGVARPKDLLALGNPAYEAAPADAARTRSQLRALPVHSEHQLREARLAWVPLPGTELEVQALRRVFPNSDAYLAREASEATLQRLNQQGALKDYRVLHFAVHGHLSTVDPALSSLVLSQADLAPGTDGYVTAAEWPGYELRSDLTILSACDTGLGPQVAGEGVLGLPFALFVAGNVNTVLSLWPVFDDVAPIFMEKFLARIKAGAGASKALADTKRELAAQPKTRHPAYWASFVLVGAG